MKRIGIVLVISIALAIVASCAAIASAEDISESDRKYSATTIFVSDNSSTIQDTENATILGYTTVVYNETSKKDAVGKNSTTGQIATLLSLGSVTILDHTMCKAVDEDTNPIDRTSQFYTTDMCAILWYKANVHTGDTFTQRWYDPNGNLEDERTYEISDIPWSSAGSKTASYLYISGDPPANKPGRWYVSLYCNGVRKFTEYFTISAPKKPDLIITDIYEKDNTIYYKIKNQGIANAGSSHSYLYIDGSKKAEDYVGSISAGSTRTEHFDFIWECSGSEDTIKVCADAKSDVPESSGTNNCKSKTLTCLFPDILVSPTKFNETLPQNTTWNGTMSIGNSGEGVLHFNIGDVDIVKSVSGIWTNPSGLTWDGQYLWLGDWWADKIYKLSPLDGSIITSFSVPGSSCNGLAWDGQYLWVSDSSEQKIYKISTTGLPLTSFSAPGGSSGWARGSVWDGQYLWHVDHHMKKIYKLNPSDGSVIKSFSAPGDGPAGLAWDGQYLWHSDCNSNMIYKIEPIIGSVITSFPASEPRGLAWDGQYLWCNVESKICQIDVAGDLAGWLSKVPTSGTVSPSSQTNITVTINTTGLAIGEYNANITITSNDHDESVVVPVNLTVRPKDITTVTVKNPTEVSEGENFTATVSADNVKSLAIFIVELTYDPSVIKLTNVERGSSITTSRWSNWNITQYTDTAMVIALSGQSGSPISGYAELARFEFDVVGVAGDKSAIEIKGSLSDSDVEPIEPKWMDSEVTVI